MNSAPSHEASDAQPAAASTPAVPASSATAVTPEVLPGQRMKSAEDWRPALSASRAKEYQKCPLQYRLHVVDGIKEPPTQATVRGTLFHSVVENLFDVPAARRTPDYAQSLFDPLWEALRSSTPGVEDLFADAAELDRWVAETRRMIDGYFSVEDPRYLEPAEREAHLVVETPEGVRLRGFIDRIDRAPSGAIRIVDYKTGKAPSPRFHDEALYQMRFYAVLMQIHEALPERTQLLYVKTGQVLTFDPHPADIERFRHQIAALWAAIESDAKRGHFPARKNALCNWCGVQQYCPAFGGTTPPLPEKGIQRLLEVRAV